MPSPPCSFRTLYGSPLRAASDRPLRLGHQEVIAHPESVSTPLLRCHRHVDQAEPRRRRPCVRNIDPDLIPRHVADRYPAHTFQCEKKDGLKPVRQKGVTQRGTRGYSVGLRLVTMADLRASPTSGAVRSIVGRGSPV